MRKVSPRLVAIMMAGAVTVTSITPVTGYQTITVNGILLWAPSPQYASMIPIEDRIMRLRIHFLRLLSICV